MAPIFWNAGYLNRELVTAECVCLIRNYLSGDYPVYYMQVDGNIFAIYNMGNIDHPIGELTEKVNDGNYHVVRFSRNGANSTLQVDDRPLLSKHPSGKKNLVWCNRLLAYFSSLSAQCPTHAEQCSILSGQCSIQFYRTYSFIGL